MDKFMLTISIVGILYGLAHFNNLTISISGTDRTNGKICSYLNTRMEVEDKYIIKDELGTGFFECPLIRYAE